MNDGQIKVAFHKVFANFDDHCAPSGHPPSARSTFLIKNFFCPWLFISRTFLRRLVRSFSIVGRVNYSASRAPSLFLATLRTRRSPEVPFVGSCNNRSRGNVRFRWWRQWFFGVFFFTFRRQTPDIPKNQHVSHRQRSRVWPLAQVARGSFIALWNGAGREITSRNKLSTFGIYCGQRCDKIGGQTIFFFS